MGQENQTQKTIEFNTVDRKTRPRDHIWAKTIYGIQHSGTGKSDPKDDRIQHSWQENQTQRPYMGKALYGQRPYMGFNTVGQENQTQKTIEFNTVGRKTRPRDHIWAKPYMGKDHIWDSTQWDRKIRPKRRYNSTQLAGKPDPETIYGQRPYMGFNTVGQENQTQNTIEFNCTVGTGKPDPMTIYGQRPYVGFNTVGTGKLNKGFNTVDPGKPNENKTIGFNTVDPGKPSGKKIIGLCTK